MNPPDVASVTLRKVTFRLIPFLFILYIVAWLDRVNVGFAGLQMNSDLGFSSAAFGFGSGVFFVGYCLFEVPSNLVLHRVGARRWISRIMPGARQQISIASVTPFFPTQNPLGSIARSLHPLALLSLFDHSDVKKDKPAITFTSI